MFCIPDDTQASAGEVSQAYDGTGKGSFINIYLPLAPPIMYFNYFINAYESSTILYLFMFSYM